MIPYYDGYQGGAGEGQQQPQQQQAPPAVPGAMAPPPILTPTRDVEAFNRLYALHEEIGRGAFSVVYRCTNRVTGEDFAVKVLDLRPLQLREKFDQSRLRREVEIMQRLQHPHIIRLEGVFENQQTLMLVLEYAQGTELFDAILQKKRYPEEEARPIFEQVARALAYLHSLNIVHRDVKPENVILLDRPSPEGYFPFAKLLDFGLSKMIGQDDGSAARTFVGTPCYLAPEVEARAYGRGHAYGTKVDCWSLGAVLYVMLVARFPEFDRSNGGMRVKLDAPAWGGVSEAAKDLIRCLMNVDPNARFSVQQALQHPWVTGLPFHGPSASSAVAAAATHGAAGLMQGMGRLAVGGGPQRPLPTVPQHQPLPAFDGGRNMSSDSAGSDGGAAGAGMTQGMEIFKLTSTGDQVRTNIKMEPGVTVVRASQPAQAGGDGLPSGGVAGGMMAPPPLPGQAPPLSQQQQQQLLPFTGEGMKLLPLVNIQHTIAHSIELAHRACEHSPEDAHDIKRSAILCRSQLIYTIKLLRKIEQTAASVLEMFPDLELAVEEGEPALAHDFFNTVKRWVGDLRHTVAEAQHRNQESMLKLHKILYRDGDAGSSPLLGPPSAHPAVTEAAAFDLNEDAEAEPAAKRVESLASSKSSSVESESMEVGAGGNSGSSSGSKKVSRVRSREEEAEAAYGLSGAGRSDSAASAERQREAGLMNLDPELYHAMKKLKEANSSSEEGGGAGKEVALSEDQLMDLFFSTTGQQHQQGGQQSPQQPVQQPPAPASASASAPQQQPAQDAASAAIAGLGGYVEAEAAAAGATVEGSSSPVDSRSGSTESAASAADSAAAAAGAAPPAGGGGAPLAMEQSVDGAGGRQGSAAMVVEGPGQGQQAAGSAGSGGSSESAAREKARELGLVLQKLKDVDTILESLAVFWAQTEVILDVLLQKGDHVERFINFAHKPRLLSRFQQRMGEYRNFWAGIQAMCHHYTTAVTQAQPMGGGGGGVGAHQFGVPGAMTGHHHHPYGFLETRG